MSAIGAGLITDSEKQQLLAMMQRNRGAMPATPLGMQAMAAQRVQSPDFLPTGAAGPQMPDLMPPAQDAPAAPPPPTTHDVTVVTTKKLRQAKVLGVPPEEFGIERGARDIKTCNYCFHEVVTKSEAQLVAEGFDADQIAASEDYTGFTEIETLERDTVYEHLSGTAAGGTENKSARIVKITEHYIRMDYEGNGVPMLYQVITSGDKADILRKDGKDCITPFDAVPFAATTPVPQTHRFFGRSMADLVMSVQKEKTAIKRGMLDNVYLRNNPRVEVAENNAGPNTLDDLLVSRPGGVIRTKQVGGVVWQEVPDVTGSAYPMLQYLDAEVASRTGVNKQSNGVDANALQNQSATAVAQVFSESQMRMKLIARITAEGVRDIFSLLHTTIRKHGQQVQTARLRNKWVSIDPRGWKTRNDMTINVGLGTGGKAQQFAQTMAIANVQKEMVAAGKTNIVGDSELYNTATELTRIMGHKNANKFFKDPDAKGPDGQLLNPPPQPKPDPKVQAIQAKAQVDQQSAQTSAQLDMTKAQHKAQLDQQSANNDLVHQQVSAQVELALAKTKADLDAKLAILQAHIDAAVTAHTEGRKQQTHHVAMHHEGERHKQAMAAGALDMIAGAQSHTRSMEASQQKSDEGKSNEN